MCCASSCGGGGVVCVVSGCGSVVWCVMYQAVVMVCDLSGYGGGV